MRVSLVSILSREKGIKSLGMEPSILVIFRIIERMGRDG